MTIVLNHRKEYINYEQDRNMLGLGRLFENVGALTAYEALERVYDRLTSSGRRLRFVSPRADCSILDEEAVHIIIAYEDDPCRPRESYMRYSGAHLVTVEGKPWVLALGVKTGSYLSDDLHSDLLALPLSKVDRAVEGIPERERAFPRYAAIPTTLKRSDVMTLSDKELLPAVKDYISLLGGESEHPFYNSVLVARKEGKFAIPRKGIAIRVAHAVRPKLEELLVPESRPTKFRRAITEVLTQEVLSALKEN